MSERKTMNIFEFLRDAFNEFQTFSKFSTFFENCTSTFLTRWPCRSKFSAGLYFMKFISSIMTKLLLGCQVLPLIAERHKNNDENTSVLVIHMTLTVIFRRIILSNFDRTRWLFLRWLSNGQHFQVNFFVTFFSHDCEI